MKNINPVRTHAWKQLIKHFHSMKKIHIKDLFNKEKNRFANFSKTFQNKILVDYSKNLITKETMKKLISLAEECDLKKAIFDMFSGKKINKTENKSVLHTALRNKKNIPILINGLNIIPEIQCTLNKMKKFSKNLIQGVWTGYTNKAITDVVSIGIGGSNLGPHMVTEALKPYKNHLNIHFIANIDGSNIIEVLKKLSPETTLFTIASKTFTTQETITNALSARSWFLQYAHDEKNISKHFIALSENINEVKNFGIDIEHNMFKFWDWVGGRFSLWSSVGLPIMLSIGPKNFEKLLNGAHDMDTHFRDTPMEENIPIILALIGIWYNNFFKTETEAILTYDEYMHKFSEFLQQNSMESNGKCTDRNGNTIHYQTSPIIWGGLGTISQHSFYQLMHQGTKMIPCDFIIPINSHNPIFDHHEKLIANFLAQTKTLAFGNLHKKNQQKRCNNQLHKNKEKFLLSFKKCKGNKPSNSILIKKITPYTLGALIAIYEHKIFTQGIIFNIYSFDQWGVQLGKKITKEILAKLKNDRNITNYDSSTNNLIKYYQSWKQKTH